MSLCDIQPVPAGVSDFILSGQTKDSVTVPARFGVLSAHLFFGVALRMRDYAYYHFTWKHPRWLNAFPSHGFNHCYGLGSGKCHLKAHAVAFCLYNETGKCIYSIEKLLAVRVRTWYCFLKTIHSWYIYCFGLVVVRFMSGVFWNCCGAMWTQAKQGTKQPALLFQSYSGFLGCYFASTLTHTAWMVHPFFFFFTWVHNSNLLSGGFIKRSFQIPDCAKL